MTLSLLLTAMEIPTWVAGVVGFGVLFLGLLAVLTLGMSRPHS